MSTLTLSESALSDHDEQFLIRDKDWTSELEPKTLAYIICLNLPSKPSPSSMLEPLYASHVSPRWRNIALASPLLWTQVYYNPYSREPGRERLNIRSIDMIMHWLRLSGDLPLDITAYVRGYEEFWTIPPLITAVARWRVVHLELDYVGYFGLNFPDYFGAGIPMESAREIEGEDEDEGSDDLGDDPDYTEDDSDSTADSEILEYQEHDEGEVVSREDEVATASAFDMISSYHPVFDDTLFYSRVAPHLIELTVDLQIEIVSPTTRFLTYLANLSPRLKRVSWSGPSPILSANIYTKLHSVDISGTQLWSTAEYVDLIRECVNLDQLVICLYSFPGPVMDQPALPVDSERLGKAILPCTNNSLRHLSVTVGLEPSMPPFFEYLTLPKLEKLKLRTTVWSTEVILAFLVRSNAQLKELSLGEWRIRNPNLRARESRFPALDHLLSHKSLFRSLHTLKLGYSALNRRLVDMMMVPWCKPTKDSNLAQAFANLTVDIISTRTPPFPSLTRIDLTDNFPKLVKPDHLARMLESRFKAGLKMDVSLARWSWGDLRTARRLFELHRSGGFKFSCPFFSVGMRDLRGIAWINKETGKPLKPAQDSLPGFDCAGEFPTLEEYDHM